MESEKENNVEVHNKEIKKKDDLGELLKNLNIKSESTKQNLESFSFDLSEDNDFPNGLIFFFKDNDSEAEYLSLVENLEEAQKAVNEKLLRLAAEFENYKKRSLQDKDSASNYAKETVLKEVLNFIDNFERGLILYEKDNKDSSFYKGMSAVFKECDVFLKKNSIEKIKCSVDDEFDPTFHEALEVSKSDQIDKDKIINIIQDGYLIKDKLFRPTLVTVSSGKGDSDE